MGKCVGDVGTVWAVVKTMGPIIDKTDWKGFCEGFVKFLKSAYNKVCDLLTAMKNAAKSASQKFMEITRRIFASLMEHYERFVELLETAFSNVVVREPGKVTITLGTFTMTLAPPAVLDHMIKNQRDSWSERQRRDVRQYVQDDAKEAIPENVEISHDPNLIKDALVVLINGILPLVMWIGPRV